MTFASLRKRVPLIAGAAAAVLLGSAAPAAAHVTVNPDTATQGGYTKVTFRVPNETASADTTKLEVNLPADTPVASVSLRPVLGWTAVAQKSKLATPIKTGDREVTEAITKITWTARSGAAIKPGQFQEFDVSLGPLPKADRMIFKALQTYSDGTVVRWIGEPATDGTEPEHPAPVLKLAAAGTPPAAPAGPAITTTAGDSRHTALWLSVAAFVLALGGLVAGLLAYRRSGPRSGTTGAAAPSAQETVSAGKAR
jgi:uncharacterized protein YcnI